MDPDIEKRLKAIEEKLDDTYRIVYRMRKVQRTNTTMRALYWVFIVLLAFGAFYYVQPYFQQLKDVYGLVSGSGDSQNFQDFINQFTGEDK